MKHLLLSIFALLLLKTSAQDCSELFFSEYLEGYGQNKALEIYNPTSINIDLSQYQIERYSNGSTSSAAGGITVLSGTIAPGDVFVITNGDTDTSGQFGFIDALLFAKADFSEPNGSYPTPLHMNGNDAIVLMKGSQVIDVIGRVGEDPGVCWTDNAASGFVSGTSATGFNPGTWYTTGQTLIRKSTVKLGDDVAVDLFNPSLEWDTLPPIDWANLGSHTCDCNTSSSISEEMKNINFSIYPNPAVASDNFRITSDLAINEVNVYNILSERVICTDKNIFSAQKLTKGTYIVNVLFQDGSSGTSKLIIK